MIAIVMMTGHGVRLQDYQVWHFAVFLLCLGESNKFKIGWYHLVRICKKGLERDCNSTHELYMLHVT